MEGEGWGGQKLGPHRTWLSQRLRVVAFSHTDAAGMESQVGSPDPSTRDSQGVTCTWVGGRQIPAADEE